MYSRLISMSPQQTSNNENCAAVLKIDLGYDEYTKSTMILTNNCCTVESSCVASATNCRRTNQPIAGTQSRDSEHDVWKLWTEFVGWLQVYAWPSASDSANLPFTIFANWCNLPDGIWQCTEHL